MKKIFIVAQVRDWFNQLHREKISFSKFVELLNEKVTQQSTDSSEKSSTFTFNNRKIW